MCVSGNNGNTMKKKNGKFVTEIRCTIAIELSVFKQLIPCWHCGPFPHFLDYVPLVNCVTLLYSLFFVLTYAPHFSLSLSAIRLLYKSTGEVKPADNNGASAVRFGHTSENVCGKYIATDEMYAT